MPKLKLDVTDIRCFLLSSLALRHTKVQLISEEFIPHFVASDCIRLLCDVTELTPT